MSNPNLYMPRLLRVIPVHENPDTPSSDQIIDLIFIDVPEGSPGIFTVGAPDSENNIMLTYDGIFPAESPTDPATTTLLYKVVSPAGTVQYTVSSRDTEPDHPIKKGTPIDPINVPRDGGDVRITRGLPEAPQPFECHPMVLQSATNTDQYFSGGIIHFPAGSGNPSYQNTNDTVLYLGYTSNLPASDHLDFVFESDTLLAENLESLNVPGTKFSKMYVGGFESLGCEFMRAADPNTNPPITALNLYEDTSTLVTF
jgi:hypothetical protein